MDPPDLSALPGYVRSVLEAAARDATRALPHGWGDELVDPWEMTRDPWGLPAVAGLVVAGGPTLHMGTLVLAAPRRRLVRTTLGWAQLGRHLAEEEWDVLRVEDLLRDAEACCAAMREELLR